jgi:hypothetical protein
VRTKARQTYTRLAAGDYGSILSISGVNKDELAQEEAVIQSTLKRRRWVVSVDAPKAPKAPVIAIRSPKAKQTRGEKKGKDSVEINGQLYEYYNYK